MKVGFAVLAFYGVASPFLIVALAAMRASALAENDAAIAWERRWQPRTPIASGALRSPVPAAHAGICPRCGFSWTAPQGVECLDAGHVATAAGWLRT